MGRVSFDEPPARTLSPTPRKPLDSLEYLLYSSFRVFTLAAVAAALRATMTKENTKTRILDIALELFNQEGSHSVSTNHIAEAMGISPGNLYYHYLNKEEVVRALFERLVEEWAVVYRLPEDRMPNLEDLDQMLTGNFAALWRYRFIYREQMALAQRDPQFKQRYQEVRAAGFENFRGLLEVFAKGGIIEKPRNKQEVEELAQLLWIVGDFWLSFIELGGVEFSPERSQEGIRLFRRILRPYLKG